MNTSNPSFTLTIGEFSDLIREIVSEELQKLLAPNTVEYEDEHFTIEGLTTFLNCSKASVHNYKKNGMPYYRIGRKVLFQKSEILAFLKTHGKKIKKSSQGRLKS